MNRVIDSFELSACPLPRVLLSRLLVCFAFKVVMSYFPPTYMNNLAEAAKALRAISDELPANAPAVDEDREASWGPVVLCESTTWEDFQDWLEENDGKIRRWIFEPFCAGVGKGRVVTYCTNSHARRYTRSEIETDINISLLKLGAPFKTFATTGSPTCVIEHFAQEPCASFMPEKLNVGGAVMAAMNGHPFPTVVIEVAHKNESLGALRTKLEAWMDQNWTSVQVAIGVKIFVSSLRQIAILHLRGQPVEEVEFGLDCQGTAPLTLKFPIAAVYAGVDLPPVVAALDNPMVSIDLIELRERVGKMLLRIGARKA